MMQIGELARRAGVQASAIRYYESIGLLAPQGRVGGRREFGEEALERLAVIALAKRLGFTLKEVRELFGGFAVARWRPLATRKLAELDEMRLRIHRMQSFLRKIVRCGCIDVEACGRALLKEPGCRSAAK